MSRRQRRTIATHTAIAVAGMFATFFAAFVALPLMYGLDSALYLALITAGLLVVLAGCQLTTPRRRRVA